MSTKTISRQERAKKQRNWLKKAFAIDENTFPNENVQAVQDYWTKMSGGQYTVDPIYCQFYSQATGEFDPRYIPDDFQYWTLEYKCINFDYIRAFTDKNYLDLILKGIKMPETIVHCIKGAYLDANYQSISKEEALEKLKAERENGFVRKISIASYGGSGVSFAAPNTDEKDLEKYLSLNDSNNFVIQKLIRQHPDMAVFNKNSVNSVRVLSIRRNDTVYLASTVVRMGVNGSQVDNFSSGGVCCGVDENGYLKKYCYDAAGKKMTTHPSGIEMLGMKVPSYNKVREQVKILHDRFPQFGIISWDFAIDEDGDPVLIEYNVGRGGIHIHQLCNGPLYGDMTDQLIREAFGVAKALPGITAPKITFAQLNEKGLPRLVWEPVAGAVKYEVYRGVEKTGIMKKMFTTEQTRYTNVTISRGKNYSYRVWAIGKDGLRVPEGCSQIVEIAVK